MERLKNLFKKDKVQDKPAVQTFESNAATTQGTGANAVEGTDTDAVKKAKHGEPGVCCGSCSN